MKTCKQCKITKELVDYYGNGTSSKCKDCTKEGVKANRLDKLEYYQSYDRNRPNKEERVEQTKTYHSTDKGKEVRAAATKNYRTAHPLKYQATNKVNNAIRDGKLVRPTTCSSCNTTCKPHGHHNDYLKPLDVVWYCEPCHQEWHRNNKVLNDD